jgi:hypothetical protein
MLKLTDPFYGGQNVTGWCYGYNRLRKNDRFSLDYIVG